MMSEWIDQARAWSGGATLIGVALFLFGSARLVGLIDESLEIIFEVPPKDPMTFTQSVVLFLKTEATSVAVALGAGVLMTSSLFLRALASSVFGEGGFALDAIWMIGRGSLRSPSGRARLA